MNLKVTPNRGQADNEIQYYSNYLDFTSNERKTTMGKGESKFPKVLRDKSYLSKKIVLSVFIYYHRV